MSLKQMAISAVAVTAAESVDVAEDGAVEIAVPANVSSGFYRLQSKGR